MYKVVQCLFKARKRKREGCIEGSQKAQRVEEDVEHAEALLHPAKSEDFLEMVSDGTRRRCHLTFQTATADYVVHLIVCAVCAGENDIGDHPDALQQVVIGNMPNPALLHPHTPLRCISSLVAYCSNRKVYLEIVVVSSWLMSVKNAGQIL